MQRHWETKLFSFLRNENLHVSGLMLMGFFSCCKNKIMKAHDVLYLIKLKTVITSCKGIQDSLGFLPNPVPWIQYSR